MIAKKKKKTDVSWKRMVVDKGRWGHDLLLVDVDGFPAIPELVHDPDDAVDAGNSHHHDPDELPGLVRLVPVEHRVDVHLSVGVHAAASPVAKAEDHVVEHEQRRLVQVEDVARPARHQQIRHRRHAVHPVHHEIHYMKRTYFHCIPLTWFEFEDYVNSMKHS